MLRPSSARLRIAILRHRPSAEGNIPGVICAAVMAPPDVAAYPHAPYSSFIQARFAEDAAVVMSRSCEYQE
jgi:hypothetical protein